ncbi:hypothetical protein Aca07nite_56600 [Actinoplanes capillaceus]|uniref:Uncharacterized protein n=1 Tax=Actinoplanes campanulatus TaxID=113559 RepID=A0ABQ3WQ22_9ACTN|nr:DUF5908 family protein [Actinoplanes capillaceus]GID48385.1 hypothetical protein Aca07nite_56600 [Actinoplanes capillaceus]
MAVTIGEIVTETVVAAPSPVPPTAGEPAGDADLEVIVHRATERVLEILRRKWDR